MEKCKYRNCKKEVEGCKIYCCRSHKENEKKYRNRQNNQKPIGRPKGVYKRINELNDDDKRVLEILFGKTK